MGHLGKEFFLKFWNFFRSPLQFYTKCVRTLCPCNKKFLQVLLGISAYATVMIAASTSNFRPEPQFSHNSGVDRHAFPWLDARRLIRTFAAPPALGYGGSIMLASLTLGRGTGTGIRLMKELARSALSGVVVSVMLMGPALAAQESSTPADHRKITQARQARNHVTLTQRARRAPAVHLTASHTPARLASVHTAAFLDDSPGVARGQQSGLASWYGGQRWHGKPTSSGGTYDQDALTAAHASLPMGTRVRVTLVDSGRDVVVTINDRPGTRRRIIDLSRGAARELGILERGVAMVTLTPL